MGNVSSMAPATRDNFEDFLTSSQEKRKVIEEKLNTAISQLIEADFWLLPSPNEYAAHTTSGEPSENYAALAKRLDVAEARVREWSDMGLPTHQDTAVIDKVDTIQIDHLSSRPPKRRRTSLRGSWTEASDVSDIMERLVCIETKAAELEGETLHGERLTEKIEERLEPMWQASGLSKSNANLDHDGLTKSNPSGEECPAAIRHTQPKLPGSIINRLDSDLNILCDELASLSTAGAGLELQIGQLRSETEVLKETTARVGGNVPLLIHTHLVHHKQVASSELRLQEEQAELNRQLFDLTADLIEMRVVPTSHSAFANQRDKLVREAIGDVQGRVDVTLEHLQSTIASQYRDIQSSVFKSLEPTLLMTDAIYDAMGYRFETRKGGGTDAENL